MRAYGVQLRRSGVVAAAVATALMLSTAPATADDRLAGSDALAEAAHCGHWDGWTLVGGTDGLCTYELDEARAEELELLGEIAMGMRDDSRSPDQVCVYEESYSSLSSQGDFWSFVGPAKGMENNTSVPQTMTTHASTSGTVTLSVSASVSVQAGVIVSGVEATFSIGASYSKTVTEGMSAVVTVPPHSEVVVRFGVKRRTTDGTYYKFSMTPWLCSSTSSSVTARTPWYVGYQVNEV